MHVLRTKPRECGRVQIIISRLKSLHIWSKTIICWIKSLLYSRARFIWRRVTVIGLLKTVRAWIKAIVHRSKSKRVAIASQASGIGHADARPGTSAAWRQLHIDPGQKHAAKDKLANAQDEEQDQEQGQDSEYDNHRHT